MVAQATNQPTTFEALRATVQETARRHPAYRTPFTGTPVSMMPSNTRYLIQTARLGLRMSLEGRSPESMRPDAQPMPQLGVAIDFDLIDYPSPQSEMLRSLIINHRRRR